MYSINEKLFYQHFDESKAEGWKYVDLNIKLVKENLNSILYSLVEPLWLKYNATIDSMYAII